MDPVAKLKRETAFKALLQHTDKLFKLLDKYSAEEPSTELPDHATVTLNYYDFHSLVALALFTGGLMKEAVRAAGAGQPS